MGRMRQIRSALGEVFQRQRPAGEDGFDPSVLSDGELEELDGLLTKAGGDPDYDPASGEDPYPDLKELESGERDRLAALLDKCKGA